MNESKIDGAERLYYSGLSTRLVAKSLKLSRGTVERWMEQGKIKRRTIHEAMKIATTFNRCGHPISLKNKRKLSILQKKRFKENPQLHPNYKLAGNRNRMTYPEKVVFDFLKSIDVSFIHNAYVAPYWIDFKVGNIGIEIDGERWHNKKRDAKRDTFLKTRGVTIYRFPAKSVLKNVSIVSRALPECRP